LLLSSGLPSAPAAARGTTAAPRARRASRAAGPGARSAV